MLPQLTYSSDKYLLFGIKKEKKKLTSNDWLSSCVTYLQLKMLSQVRKLDFIYLAKKILNIFNMIKKTAYCTGRI